MTHPYATESDRWQAVKERDKDAAHTFYYAVKTTGIYCVPGCSSRLPKRENVEFFETTDQAVGAGFRACKRCRPDDPAHAGILSNRIVHACRTIEQAETIPSLTSLARACGLSPSHFQRLFTEHVGVSPKVYGQAIRESRVRAALGQGTSVTQAIFDAGYGAASRFYEQSDAVIGMTARKYRKGGAGLDIRYACGESYLGLILAAFTDRGVCSIEFGDSEEQLVDSLSARFPEADLRHGGVHLRDQLAEIVSFIRSPATGLALPLDIQGTAFQQRVWKELQKIPAGETRTYSEVAQALGVPGSVRAVASACARNRLAVVVPCHRVLRKGGLLAGYHWGLERKAALLENEKDVKES